MGINDLPLRTYIPQLTKPTSIYCTFRGYQPDLELGHQFDWSTILLPLLIHIACREKTNSITFIEMKSQTSRICFSITNENGSTSNSSPGTKALCSHPTAAIIILRVNIKAANHIHDRLSLREKVTEREQLLFPKPTKWGHMMGLRRDRPRDLIHIGWDRYYVARTLFITMSMWALMIRNNH